MSYSKILGTETEFRLDSPTAREYNLKYLEEWELPETVVRSAVALSGDFILGDLPKGRGKLIETITNDELSRNERFGETLASLKSKFPMYEHAVKEHRERSDEPQFMHERQRFGFTGGYLGSGFRIYRDGAHIEVSTPECRTPLDLVRWEKAGERLAERGRIDAEIKSGHKIIVSKDTSDGNGNSWGAHENYLVNGSLFSKLIGTGGYRFRCHEQFIWASYLLSRIIFCGSGKFGSEVSHKRNKKFLISQRAEFVTEELSHNTMFGRGIINSRDIPYVDEEFGHRLHVIIGDANMSEVAIYLKTGTALIMLMMLEDGWFLKNQFPVFLSPLSNINFLANDLTCRNCQDVSIGGITKQMSALDVSMFFLDSASKWYVEKLSGNPEYFWINGVLETLCGVCDKLASGDLESLFGTLDWVTKYILCSRDLDRSSLGWGDLRSGSSPADRLVGICGAYHRLDESGIYNRLLKRGRILRLLEDEDISYACLNPPNNTRAFDRSELLRRYAGEVDFVNWYMVSVQSHEKAIRLGSPFLGGSDGIS